MEKTNNNFGNTRKGFEDNANINIEKEVSELIKKGADKVSMNEVRRKFGDDKVFDMVQEAYFDKLASIRKRSIKFTKLIERKYGMFGHPLHIILNKAIKYKKRYDLSDEEFELFRQYYQKSMNVRPNGHKYDVLVPNTNMAKVFGDDPYTNNKIHVGDGDHRLVKDILALYDMNRAMWQQVTLQSITYDFNANLAVEKFAVIEAKTTNFSSFIHPVIAAMFLPKIAKFDEYFLFTNLAYILRCKYLGEPISTYHSYLMLYNLVTDPNDVVCNADSPLKDILNRVLLQVTLWKNVLRLRQGGVYDTYNSFVAADFMINVDNCKLSTYDAPDLMMIGDENVIIRRLLSSLAFRCATVFSTPLSIPFYQGQNNMQISSVSIPMNLTQVTKVPMIYIRLPVGGLPAPPPLAIGNQQISNNLNIQSALTTVQPIMNNGRYESRMMSIVGTDGILIVSIPRRTYKPVGGGIYNLPQVFNFANMPHHAFGLESLNDTTVNTNVFLKLTNLNEDKDMFTDKLFLKSAVVLKQKETEKNNKFIFGSKTYVFDYINRGDEIYGSANSTRANLIIYDPIPETTRIGIKPIRLFIGESDINDTEQDGGSDTDFDVAKQTKKETDSNNNRQSRLENQQKEYGNTMENALNGYKESNSNPDKLYDFNKNQTILIYTNELTSNNNENNKNKIKKVYTEVVSDNKEDPKTKICITNYIGYKDDEADKNRYLQLDDFAGLLVGKVNTPTPTASTKSTKGSSSKPILDAKEQSIQDAANKTNAVFAALDSEDEEEEKDNKV